MAIITDVSTFLGSHPVLALVGGFFTYHVLLALFRIIFHPLAHIPGPRLAAMTHLYEFYYDFVLGGQYTFKLPQLHSQYGPIIRISPCEVHIHDADFYDQIYTGPSKPRDKWSKTTECFGIPTSSFATVSATQHRTRRGELNPFFSQKSVFGLEALFVEKVQKLCTRIEEWRGTGRVLLVTYAMSALVIDVVTEYAFAQPYGSLDHPEFAPFWPDCIDNIAKNAYMEMYFPWLTAFMKGLPQWLVVKLSPGLSHILDFQAKLKEQIATIMAQEAQGKTPTTAHPTIFHGFLNDPDLPPEDRNEEHFLHQAQGIVAAGQITTSVLLTSTTWYVLSTPGVLARLKAELLSAMPEPTNLPPLKVLQDLPYLTAIICEGHRLTHGLSHRAQRLSSAPMQYNTYLIPARTPVGMTHMLIHLDRDIFADPLAFNPDRWLDVAGVHPHVHPRRKYLIPFSRGTRSCLGMHLAQAEIYIALAALFRRFDFEIFGTEQADVDVVADYVSPMPRAGSKGVRVLVK